MAQGASPEIRVPAAAASLNIPEDVVFDRTGNLLIADAGNNRVRKVDGSGLISTLAGTGADGFSGDGGAATQAMLNFPWGLAADAAGNIYVADRVNSRVRMISPSLVSPPSLSSNSTVNGASFTNIISPGAIVSTFGTGLSSSLMSAAGVPLPTALGDTSITFNGIAAPLFFVSNGQIDAQAPFRSAGRRPGLDPSETRQHREQCADGKCGHRLTWNLRGSGEQ